MQVDYATGQRLVLSHKCGDCGSGLRMPYAEVGYEVRCREDAAHTTLERKDNGGTRMLYDIETKQLVEYDVMTQKPTTAISVRDLPATQTGMLERGALAKWPQDLTAADKQALAQVALAYELDFLLGELIPYQGHPYITIRGRRRLDELAGKKFKSITWRPLTAEEHEWYGAADAIAEGDLNGFAVGTFADGSFFEGFGKVTKAERAKQASNGGPRSPVVVNNPIEMFWNRSERRLREIAFGPVQRPKAVLHIPVLQEGDESNIVEGEIIPSEIYDMTETVADVTAPPKDPPAPPKAPDDERIDFDAPVPIPAQVHSLSHFASIIGNRGWDLDRFGKDVLQQPLSKYLKDHELNDALELFREAVAA